MPRIMRITAALALLGCNQPADQSNAVDQLALAQASDVAIERHLKLMDQAGTEREWQDSIERLRRAPDSVARLVALYDAGSSTPEGDANRVRWKAVHTLGHLKKAEAVPHLARIAQDPLPDPKAGEDLFASEYRIRLRAIAGLERLGADKELQRLQDKGGPLRDAAVASLFELGRPVAGSRALDPSTVMGPGDPRDHNPRTNPRPHRTKPSAGN